MSQPDNPYTAPASDPVQYSTQSSSAVSEATIDMLRRTKGWVRFLAILGFISCGIMLLTGLATIAMFNAKAQQLSGIGLPAWIGFAYLIFAVLYFYPVYRLNQYANRIGHLVVSKSETDLVAALDSQRGFWFFLGIVTLFVLTAYIILIIIFATILNHS